MPTDPRWAGGRLFGVQVPPIPHPNPLAEALADVLDDYLATHGPDGYPHPMPQSWRYIQDWLAAGYEARPKLTAERLAAALEHATDGNPEDHKGDCWCESGTDDD